MIGYGVMKAQLEFIIGLTAFYLNGSRDYFTVKHRDFDEESARYSVWHSFKSLTNNQDIECLITNIARTAS